MKAARSDITGEKKASIGDLPRELPLHWTGSLQDYEELVRKNPSAHMRAARQYLYDAVFSFGVGTETNEATGETLTRYGIFSDALASRKERAVHGMDRTLDVLMRHLRSRAARPRDLPRMIVLNGPPGSSKSTTIERLRVALEEYSCVDEGALFTTTILLAAERDSHGKQPIGFVMEKGELPGSYAHLPSDKILAQITCPQHDSPLLWYPRETRGEKLEEMLASAGDHFELPEELLYGELCPTCSQIYDRLLSEYKGDWEQVARHVRVDRVKVKGDVAGVATVQPGETNNLISLAMTQDPNYQFFAERFPGIRLVELDGPFLRANRGFIHLEDFVKANRDFNYLLRAISNGEVTTRDQRTGKDTTIRVDEVIFASDNVEGVEAVRHNPITQGFDSRMFVLEWPYVVRPSDEVKIYADDFGMGTAGEVGQGTRASPHIAPHVQELAALFAVLTRYEKPDANHYLGVKGCNDQTKAIIESLTPMDKAELHEGRIPRRFGKEEARLLTQPIWQAILGEHQDEGLIGIGVRDMQEIVNLLKGDEACPCIEPTDLFSVLEDYLKTQSFHYLAPAIEGPYHDVHQAFAEISREYGRVIRREVRQAMTDVSPEMISGWVSEYIDLVSTTYQAKYLPKPQRADPQAEEADIEKKILEVESHIPIKDSREKFRDELRMRVARYADQLKTSEGYRRVFPEIYDALEDFQYSKVAERLYPTQAKRDKFLEAVAQWDPANQKDEMFGKDLARIFGRMHDLGYCDDCAGYTLLQAFHRKLL